MDDEQIRPQFSYDVALTAKWMEPDVLTDRMPTCRKIFIIDSNQLEAAYLFGRML